MRFRNKPAVKLFVALGCFIIATAFTSFNTNSSKPEAASVSVLPVPAVGAEDLTEALIGSLYEEIGLEERGLNFKAFELAFRGLKKLEAKDRGLETGLLTIIDFSQPSTRKRLYVIDIQSKEVVFQTYVAHGKNSGTLMATKFSNKVSSYQSSLGFYKTASTYNGKHGYSLRLIGLEPGINSNAMARAIVMHSADYVSEKTIQSLGYLGRSLGCPAIPAEFHKPVINLIKDGTLLFIYHPSDAYLKQSALLG